MPTRPSAQGRALYLQGCSTCHGLSAQGSTEGPEPRRRRRRRRGLPDVHRAHAAGRARARRRPQAADLLADADRPDRRLHPDPRRRTGDPDVTDAELERRRPVRRRRAVPGELRAVPPGRRRGRSADLRQVRPVAERGHPGSDRRGDAHRARVDAGVRAGPGRPTRSAVAVAAYIRHLQDTPAPGGLSLGNYGPVPEGLVAWVVGIGASARRVASGSERGRSVSERDDELPRRARGSCPPTRPSGGCTTPATGRAG